MFSFAFENIAEMNLITSSSFLKVSATTSTTLCKTTTSLSPTIQSLLECDRQDPQTEENNGVIKFEIINNHECHSYADPVPVTSTVVTAAAVGSLQVPLLQQQQHNTHNQRMLWLIQAKNLFARQLPKMPREYVMRLVFSSSHETMCLIKGNKVIGVRFIYILHRILFDLIL